MRLDRLSYLGVSLPEVRLFFGSFSGGFRGIKIKPILLTFDTFHSDRFTLIAK